MSDGFSGTQAAKVVGITYRQLDYWARTESDPARRSPTHRGAAAVAGTATTICSSCGSSRRCSTPGIKLESVREVFNYLRQHVSGDIASAHLVINGSSVVLAHGDELIDVLAKGQGVLNVLSLAGVKDEVDAQLVPLEADADTDHRRASPADARDANGHRSTTAIAPLGAKMVPFGGWEMPLEYAGTIDEHLACRQGAVVFDVSHLGTVRVEGDGAHDRLQATLTNDLGKIGPGRAQYTHLLDDRRLGARRHHRVVASRRRFRLRRDAECVQHRTCARCDRGHRHHRHPCGTGRPGSDCPPAARLGLPGGVRGRPVPRRPSCLGRRRLPDRRHGLHRRTRCRDRGARRDAALALGCRRRCRRRAQPGSAPATPCDSRPACRSTATSSVLGSLRCRPDSAGWSPSTSRSSVAGPRSSPNVRSARRRLLRGIATEGRRPPRSGCAVLVADDLVGCRDIGQLLTDARSRHRDGVRSS